MPVYVCVWNLEPPAEVTLKLSNLSFGILLKCHVHTSRRHLIIVTVTQKLDQKRDFVNKILAKNKGMQSLFEHKMQTLSGIFFSVSHHLPFPFAVIRLLVDITITHTRNLNKPLPTSIQFKLYSLFKNGVFILLNFWALKFVWKTIT